ncbi:MAG: hypothetical protein WEA31_08975 [Pirellulales bacterium]
MCSRRASIVLIGLLAVAGCGGEPVGEVAGTVTLAGQPLGMGAIVFENAESGLSVSANLDADGAYKLQTATADGLPPGSYLVSVRPGVIGTGETPLVGGAAETTFDAIPAIPARYHQGSTSGLTAEVVEGANPLFNFDLAGDGPGGLQ